MSIDEREQHFAICGGRCNDERDDDGRFLCWQWAAEGTVCPPPPSEPRT